MDKIIAMRAKSLASQIEDEGRELGTQIICRPLTGRRVTKKTRRPPLEHSIVRINDHDHDAWLIWRINGDGAPHEDRLYLATTVGIVIQFRRCVCTPSYFWVRDPYDRNSGHGILHYGDGLGIRELEWVLQCIEELKQPDKPYKPPSKKPAAKPASKTSTAKALTKRERLDRLNKRRQEEGLDSITSSS